MSREGSDDASGGSDDDGSVAETAEQSRADGSVQPDLSAAVSSAVLSLDHVFEALEHPRRRYVCYALSERDEWSLPELATRIVAWERSVDPGSVDGEDRETVLISLYHSHVPTLRDRGVVQFDEAAGTVTPGENADQVLAALEGVGASLDSRQEAHAREASRGDDDDGGDE
jgi:hypothetical protein